MQHAPRFLKLVEEARASVKECSIDELKKRVDTGERAGTKTLIVDTREDHEWQNGHVPGAVHLGKGIIERDIEKAVPDIHTPIYLYCGGGFRSALVAQNLQKMGYTGCVSVDGGFRAWKEKGWPIVTEGK